MNKTCFILTTEDAVKWDDKLIFVSREMNLICSADLNTCQVEIVEGST